MKPTKHRVQITLDEREEKDWQLIATHLERTLWVPVHVVEGMIYRTGLAMLKAQLVENDAARHKAA